MILMLWIIFFEFLLASGWFLICAWMHETDIATLYQINPNPQISQTLAAKSTFSGETKTSCLGLGMLDGLTEELQALDARRRSPKVLLERKKTANFTLNNFGRKWRNSEFQSRSQSRSQRLLKKTQHRQTYGTGMCWALSYILRFRVTGNMKT